MTELEAAILAFESRRYRLPGHKETAIRDELGLTAPRYNQLLARLVDTEAALAVDPVLVNRLRRLKNTRRAGREVR